MQTVNYFRRGSLLALKRTQLGNGNDNDDVDRKSYVVSPHLMTAVSGAAKSDDTDVDEYRFGEDAWFVSNTPRADVLGVADGVGGWTNFGIDAGEFSTKFMLTAERRTLDPLFDPKDAKKLLIQSFEELKDEKKDVYGSTTACMLSFDRENSTVYGANFGDSGFVIVRNGMLVAHSVPQHHSFNVPYQLTVAPPDQPIFLDSPELTDDYTFKVCPGDILVLATDGVYDNLPLKHLLQILKQAETITDSATLQEVANLVAYTALELSKNEHFMSPFSIAANAHNMERTGGKQDDLTAILALVSENERVLEMPIDFGSPDGKDECRESKSADSFDRLG